MSEPEVPSQMDRLNESLFIIFRYYRRRVVSMVPEEIIRLREYLNTSDADVEALHAVPNRDLFFRIGLVALARHKEPIPMGLLSKELDVPLSTATRIINGLVDNGLAERTTDPEDRRVVQVILTETGWNLHQIMNEFMHEHFDQILSQLTAEEREQLVTLLLKITKIMDEIVK